MSLVNGQIATAATFNNALASKTDDNILLGKQALNEPSSTFVTDLQLCIEELFGIVGSFESEPTPNNYTSNTYITDGDSLKVAIGKLDAQLTTTQTQVSGHETRLDDIESNVFSFSGDKTFNDNVTITGDLTVNGTTTTVNSSTLNVTDANILINDGGNDASAEEAGLTVQRTTTNALLVFDSGLASKWKLGLAGTLYEVLVSGIAQTILGLKSFAGGIATNSIAELDLNAGVTIDGLLIKDGVATGFEPSITATTSADYYRGDKTFQTLNNTAVGLGSVTNDAQLKRAANDISTFTEKTTPAANDLFIIEDSADSGNKKKVKFSNLGSGGSFTPVLCDVRLSATQSVPLTTNTTVIYDAITLDTSSGYNSTTGEYTIQAGDAGTYEVTVGVGFEAFTGYFYPSIYINGTLLRTAIQANDSSYGGSHLVSRLCQLTVGDIITGNAYQASAGSHNLLTDSSTYMIIKRVS